MKQIRTIVRPLSSDTQFDISVNRLLLDGWELKNRTIVDTAGDISESYNFPVVRLLYAELEKDHTEKFEEVTL